MSTIAKVFIFMVIGVMLLGVSKSPQGLSSVLASSEDWINASDGVAIPYPGRLNDADGHPVIDGKYTFAFDLYDSQTGGQSLWVEVQEGITVKDGLFSILLGSLNPLPRILLDGRELWLSTSVRGAGEVQFTALEPRQPLGTNSSTLLSAVTSGAACPHDHVGEVWNANMPWSNAGLRINNSANGPALWGWNNGGGNGVRGDSWGSGIGVYGEGENGPGVVGRSDSGYGVEGHSNDGLGGVWAESISGVGLFAHSDNNSSIYVDGAGQNGVHVASAGDHGIYVASAGWSGVAVWSAAGPGMWVHSAGGDGILVDTASWDGVHVVGPVGGTYYGSGKKGDEDFAVLNTGEVRSKVGFATPANDYAVLMNVPGARSDYEPGDVLVISGDQGQSVELCASSYSPTVIGVYSASPGFLGGQSVTDQVDSTNSISVAIMGIASVKVSAENGPIKPGDLLVTSSTPGHAMRADEPVPGTILGKALGTLDSGVGMILVLLTLQ